MLNTKPSTVIDPATNNTRGVTSKVSVDPVNPCRNLARCVQN